MNHVTTQRYVGVFENLFLVHALSPWYTNTLKRLVKSPKPHFLDAGFLPPEISPVCAASPRPAATDSRRVWFCTTMTEQQA